MRREVSELKNLKGENVPRPRSLVQVDHATASSCRQDGGLPQPTTYLKYL